MDDSCKAQSKCSLPAMSLEEINQELAKISSEWQLNLAVPNKISHEFKFKNFTKALDFVNKVGSIAEELNHHPDIVLKWGYAKVEFWTHVAKGLTMQDFHSAKKIDQLS